MWRPRPSFRHSTQAQRGVRVRRDEFRRTSGAPRYRFEPAVRPATNTEGFQISGGRHVDSHQPRLETPVGGAAGLVLAAGLVDRNAAPRRGPAGLRDAARRHDHAGQCAAIPQTSGSMRWARPSASAIHVHVGGAGRRPVVFLQGDQFGRLDGAPGTSTLADTKDTNTEDLIGSRQLLQDGRDDRNLSRPHWRGRISGHHRVRHSVLELYGWTPHRRHQEAPPVRRVPSRRQSGGATLVGGLLALREDIACAVPAQAGSPNSTSRSATDPTLEAFDPYDAIPRIAQTAGPRHRRHDPRTRRSGPAPDHFAQGLEQAGKPVEQVMVQAVDENRHGVVAYAGLRSPCARRVRPRKRSKTRLSGWSKGGWLTPRTGGGAAAARTNETQPSPRTEIAHPPERTAYPRRAGDLSAIATTEPSTADHGWFDPAHAEIDERALAHEPRLT